MPDWTHLIRFIAVEDSLVHLGQLVDVTRDIGRDSVDGVEIAAYVIEGTIFDGKVTKDILHVKQVSRSPKANPAGRLIFPVAVSCFERGVQLHSLLGTELHRPCQCKSEVSIAKKIVAVAHYHKGSEHGSP